MAAICYPVIPYVSSEDIDKGARWSTDIAKELEDSRYGIICITRENMNAPWVNFEAGALSKIIDKSYVSPFLFDLKRSDVQGPLLQFQSTVFEKDDILKLLKTINARSPETEKLKDEKLTKAFDVWWSQLHDALKAIRTTDEETPKPAGKAKDKSSEILEELLELARTQQRLISNPTSLLPPDYLMHMFERIGMRTTRFGPDGELLHRIHRSIIDLEEVLQSHKKDHEAFTEALEILERIHRYFHEVPEWPRGFLPAEPKRSRRKPKDDLVSAIGLN